MSPTHQVAATNGSARVAGESPSPREQEDHAIPLRGRNLWLMIAVLGTFLFGWQVGQRGLWSAHEGRAAQNAQGMLDSGNWLMPTLYTGEPDYDKPPLYYWMVALTTSLGGETVSPFAVRLPALVAAVVGLLLVYWLGRCFWDERAGLLAAVILATSTRYAWLARVGRVDMPLTLFCIAAMAGYWHALVFFRNSSGQRTFRINRSIWIVYFCMLLGIMVKGPIAMALMLGPILAHLWWCGCAIFPGQNGWRYTWRQLRGLPGLTLVLLTAAPWFFHAIHVTQGAYFWEFFVYHHLDRAMGTSEALKSGPFWFYVPRLITDGFPWTVLLPPMVISLWRERALLRTALRGEENDSTTANTASENLVRAKEKDSFSSVETMSAENGLASETARRADWAAPIGFLLTWIISQFVFLSLVSFKRPDYLLPVFPALALLLAGWLRDRGRRFESRLANRPARDYRRQARWLLATAWLLALASLPMLVWAIVEFRKKGIVRSIFKIDLMDRYLNDTDNFMMGHVELLLRENWPLLVIFAAVVVACVGMFHAGWHQRQNRWIVASLALPWLVGYLFQVHLLLPALDPLRDMARFAEVARAQAGPGQVIYYFDKCDPDLLFHAGRPARLVNDWEQLVALGQLNKPCYVVLRHAHLDWVKRDPRMNHWRAIADNGESVHGRHHEPRYLLTNQPRTAAGQLSPNLRPLIR